VTSGTKVYFSIFNNDASSELTCFLADLVACETVLINPHGPDLSLRMALLAVRELRLPQAAESGAGQPELALL
jgi:hypothetical protein